MRMIRRIFLIVLSCYVAGNLYAVERKQSQFVPVSIQHEKGSFQGTIKIDSKMSLKNRKTTFKWNGSIENTSSHKVHSAEFCVKAFDPDGKSIHAYGSPCVFRIYGLGWGIGDVFSFNGKRKTRIDRPAEEYVNAKEEDGPVQLGSYEVSLLDVEDKSPNLRIIKAQCKFAWNPVIRVFTDDKFHPTVIDKDSFTGSFQYTGGVVTNDRNAKDMLQAFTYARTGMFTTEWSAFRIENASIFLRDDGIDRCIAEIRMSFAGFGKPFMNKFFNWIAVSSNMAYEKRLLDSIEKLALSAHEDDMERAMRELPTEIYPFSAPGKSGVDHHFRPDRSGD